MTTKKYPYLKAVATQSERLITKGGHEVTQFRAMMDPYLLHIAGATRRERIFLKSIAHGESRPVLRNEHGHLIGNVCICSVTTKSGRHVAEAFTRGNDGKIEFEEARQARFQGLIAQPEKANRFADTEFQLLNKLHKAAVLNQDDVACLFLYTEREPCESCSVVISQFLDEYRYLTIDIQYIEESKNPPPRPTWTNTLKKRIRISMVENKVTTRKLTNPFFFY